MPIILWIVTAYIIYLLVYVVVKKVRNGSKHAKPKNIGAIVLRIFSLFVICMIAWGLYEFSTECEPGFSIDPDKSYIMEEFREGDTIRYTASLCVRNRRPTIRQVIGLSLWVYGRDGNDERHEGVKAKIINLSDGECIIFAPFWSRQIECTFSIKDFGAEFNIGCIKYTDC